jgi:predicted transcriptional regulator
VKQLLLRVDDELHAHLSEIAKGQHRSVNALANEILSLVDARDRHTLREKVRVKAAALGMLAPPLKAVEQADPIEDVEALRAKVLDSMRGIGPIVDKMFEEDRDRN